MTNSKPIDPIDIHEICLLFYPKLHNLTGWYHRLDLRANDGDCGIQYWKELDDETKYFLLKQFIKKVKFYRVQSLLPTPTQGTPDAPPGVLALIRKLEVLFIEMVLDHCKVITGISDFEFKT